MTLLKIAEAHVSYGQPAKAQKAAEIARATFEQLDCRQQEQDARDVLVRAMIARNAKKEALTQAREGVIRFDKVEDRRAVARSLLMVSTAHHALGEYRQALAAAERALESFKELGARRLQATALQQVATVHVADLRADEARTAAEDALRIYRTLGDFAGETDATELLGAIEDARGEIERMAEKESEATALIKRLKEALASRNGPEFKAVLEACYEHEHVYTEEVEQVVGPVIQQDPDGTYNFFLENQPEKWRIDPKEPTKEFSEAQHFDRRQLYYWYRMGHMGYGPGFRLMSSTYRIGPKGEDSFGAASLALREEGPDWEEVAEFHPGMLDCVLQCGGARWV